MRRKQKIHFYGAGKINAHIHRTSAADRRGGFRHDPTFQIVQNQNPSLYKLFIATNLAKVAKYSTKYSFSGDFWGPVLSFIWPNFRPSGNSV
jgi:hypothetical protein